MKLLALILLLAALPAAAETITLGTVTCGTLKQCIDIPNDAGDTISLYGAPGYPYFFVSIDGVYYISAVASGNAMDSVSMQSFVNPDPTNPSIRQYTGSYLTISGTFTNYITSPATTSGAGSRVCGTGHWWAGRL